METDVGGAGHWERQGRRDTDALLAISFVSHRNAQRSAL